MVLVRHLMIYVKQGNKEGVQLITPPLDITTLPCGTILRNGGATRDAILALTRHRARFVERPLAVSERPLTVRELTEVGCSVAFSSAFCWFAM